MCGREEAIVDGVGQKQKSPVLFFNRSNSLFLSSIFFFFQLTERLSIRTVAVQNVCDFCKTITIFQYLTTPVYISTTLAWRSLQSRPLIILLREFCFSNVINPCTILFGHVSHSYIVDFYLPTVPIRPYLK